MAELFQCEAAILAAGASITAPDPIRILETNAINPPFGNCAAKVLAVLGVTAAADSTGLRAQLVRNPDAEAIVVGDAIVNGVLQDTEMTLVAGGIDQISDGRSVVYALVVSGDQNFAVAPNAYIEATLLSGAKGAGVELPA